MAKKDLVIAASVQGSDASRQDLASIRKAAEEIGPAGAKTAQGMTDAFRNIENASQKVTDKISSGRAVTERDGKVMIQQMEMLKTEIGSAFGSISKAPEAIQQAYKKAEAQFESTAKKIRVTTDAVSDQKEVLKEGAIHWGGFNDQLNKSIGKYGGLQMGALAFGAALTEGINLGMQFNQAIGADMSGLEQATQGLKDSMRGVIEQWAKGVVEMTGNSGGIIKAIRLTANEMKGLEAVQAALGHDLDDYKAHLEEIGHVEQLYSQIQKDAEMGSKLLGKARKEGAGVLGEYVTSMELANTISVTHTKLVALGVAGQQLWNEIYGTGKQTLADTVLAIERHKTAIAEVTKLTKEEITAEGELQTALNNTTAARVKAIQREKEQVDLVTNQEKVEDHLTASLRNKLAEITASMTVKEGREIPLTLKQISQLEQMITTTMGLSDAERNHLKELSAKLKGIESMTEGQRENLAQSIQYELRINSSSKADAAHVIVIDKKTHSARNAAAGVDALHESNIKITRSSGEAVDPTHKLAGAFERGAGPAKKMGESIHMAGEGLQKFATHAPITITHINDITIAANKAAEAMDRLATAQAKAANAGVSESPANSPTGAN